MPYSTRRVYFSEFIFDVSENVYEPAEDTFLLAENLTLNSDERVLDLGTGCGILGIIAAKKASYVVAVDLNPYSIRCAKKNAQLNGVLEKIHFLQGDLFTPFNFDVYFDLILFNAPYLPSEEGESTSWIGKSWAGGPNGRQVIEKFISQATVYLRKKGRILLMQSTLSGTEETVYSFAQRGFKASVVASRKLPFFETLTLIEAYR